MDFAHASNQLSSFPLGKLVILANLASLRSPSCSFLFSSSHVRSICHALDIPHLQLGAELRSRLSAAAASFTLNVHPRLQHVHTAFQVGRRKKELALKTHENVDKGF